MCVHYLGGPLVKLVNRHNVNNLLLVWYVKVRFETTDDPHFCFLLLMHTVQYVQYMQCMY